VVVTGTDVAAISREAEKIARRYWDARHDFGFEVPAGDPDWVIHEALKLGQRAVFISDAGDNLTAGAAADSAYMLSRLLAREDLVSGERSAIVAGVPSPEAVRICLDAGIGSEVSVTAGGVLDPLYGVATELSGTVVAIQRDDPIGGDTVVVRHGGITAVLTARRKVFFERSDFEAVGLDVDAHDLIVVKVGYLFPGQRAMASAALLALSPGAVSLDIPSLPYHLVQRPIFPLDPDMPDPDLTPTIFAPIGGS
jgi:microcystin degradation protein MlrC